MTRGQNSLSMEEEVEVAADGAVLEIVPLAEVIFQSATADELAAHEATIAGLDKAAKGQCIWTAVTDPASGRLRKKRAWQISSCQPLQMPQHLCDNSPRFGRLAQG